MQLVIGRIGRPHGVRGQVTVEVRTDSPELRFTAGAVLATEPLAAGPLVVDEAHWHSGRLLLTLRGVADRTAAEGLRDVRLVVDVPDDETPPDPEEFYDHQLVGLAAMVAAGGVETEVGLVSDVLHLPSQDVLVITRPDGGEALVPFVAEIVPEVDVAAGRLLLDPPPGLIADPTPDPMSNADGPAEPAPDQPA